MGKVKTKSKVASTSSSKPPKGGGSSTAGAAGFPAEHLFDSRPSKPGHVEEPIPGFVYVVRDVLSKAECQKWIDCADTSAKLEYFSQRGTRYLAARECFRMHREDSTTAQMLFERIVAACPLREKPVGCNPNIRLYKYAVGHQFGKHIDESNRVGTGVTKYTVLFYLSDCQGGETVFFYGNKQTFAFQPQAGAMLLHLHGDDCLLHQANAVSKGVKYVLRTDLVYEK